MHFIVFTHKKYIIKSHSNLKYIEHFLFSYTKILVKKWLYFAKMSVKKTLMLATSFSVTFIKVNMQKYMLWPLFRKKIALFSFHLEVPLVFRIRNDILTIVYVATSCLSKNVNNSSANHIANFHNLCHIQTCHQGNHVNHSWECFRQPLCGCLKQGVWNIWSYMLSVKLLWC